MYLGVLYGYLRPYVDCQIVNLKPIQDTPSGFLDTRDSRMNRLFRLLFPMQATSFTEKRSILCFSIWSLFVC